MSMRQEAKRGASASSRELVVRALRSKPGLTRAELSRRLGISPSTATNIVRELLAEGAVVDQEVRDERRLPALGRRGRGLVLNPRSGAVVGIDFGFRNVRVLLCDLAHNVLATCQAKLDEGHAITDAIPVTRRLVDEAVSKGGISKASLLSAGVALPGPVQHREPDSVVASAILPGWNGVTSKTFEEVLGVPVRMDNDANLAALGEHTWGAAQHLDDCVLIKFHSGIGCGLIANGSLVRGARGGAGEIGHLTIDERGPLCRCGKRGCLDSFASIPSILEALRAQHGPLSLQEMMGLLAAGDPGVARVVSDAAELVGNALAAACNLLAPQRVVIVGAMTQAGELILQPMRAALQRGVAPGEPPEVVLGALGNMHTAFGAVAMALFESDQVRGPG